MFDFLKHKFTRKEKFFARWGASHLAAAIVAGGLLAAWLVMWQNHTDAGNAEILQQQAVAAVGSSNPVPPSATKIGGPFTLTDQDGKTVSDTDFAGKFLLVYFGYTSCPDMCPTGLQSMSGALDRLKTDADRVQPIFITVDPARDTPKRLKEYGQSFSPRIIGLTGTPEQIEAVAGEYQVYYKKGEGDQDYEVDHSSLIYLIDPAGNLAATFDEEAEPQILIDGIRKAMQAPAGKP